MRNSIHWHQRESFTLHTYAKLQHEEPNARIAHVRVCGGLGQVTALAYLATIAFCEIDFS
ncbi:MAG TPA: hypothetical protein VLX29_07900 [Nitrospirota bacterium]|nr:hypothetical protein [Nitrospirota bacterium]